MTMDRTLKQHGELDRIRSVLTRTEKIAMLTDEGKFDPTKDNPLGLPKVKVKHSKAGTKTKKVAEEKTEELAPGVEGAAEAADAKSDADAKVATKPEGKKK